MHGMLVQEHGRKPVTNMEDTILKALTAIRDYKSYEGQPYKEMVEELKQIAAEAMKQNDPATAKDLKVLTIHDELMDWTDKKDKMQIHRKEFLDFAKQLATKI